jgi:transcriptional regulator with XRE-family HTH domain
MYFRDKLSLHQIAKRTGLSRNTIRKWVRAPEATQPAYQRCATFGMAIWGAGIVLISGDDRDRKALESNRRFNSLEPGEVDDRVMFFVQPQLNELISRKERMVIDTVVVAYLTADVNIITGKNLSCQS